MIRPDSSVIYLNRNGKPSVKLFTVGIKFVWNG